MKKWAVLIILLLATCCGASAQGFVQGYNFAQKGFDGPRAGFNFTNSGVNYFFMSWTPAGPLTSCSIQLDSSNDGTSWGSGDVIASQSCTAVGSIGGSFTKAFVRINVTVLGGAGGLNVLLQGVVGGGSGSGGITSGFSKVTSGLIGEYKLTEGTGTTIADSSTSGSGTLAAGNAAPSWNIPIASDNFLGPAAGGPLSVYWTFGKAGAAQGQMLQGSNGAFLNSASVNSGSAMYNNATFSNDQYAQLTQTSAPGAGTSLGVAVRMSFTSALTLSFYACDNTNTTMFLRKQINGDGGLSTLTSTARVGASGDIIRLQAVGTTISCTITTSAGVATTLSATDAAVTTGNPGLFAFSTFVQGRNWFAGNVTTPNTGGLWFYGGQDVVMPAALNSAQTIQLYACYQRASNANLYNALIQGNGNGAASNANGLVITGQVNLNNGPIVQQLPHLSILGGSTYGMTSYSNFNGCGVATGTFGTVAGGTADASFINGTESVYTNELHTTSGGLQTAGAYQLGGTAAGSGFATVSFLTGAVYYVLAYNRVLLPAEIQQNVNFLNETMAARGVNSFLGDTARGDTCITDGDSITNGNNVTNGFVWTQNLSFFTPANMSTFNSSGTSCWNQGVTSVSMKVLDQKFNIGMAPLFNTSARNVVVLWAGTNDMQVAGVGLPDSYGSTAGQVLQSMKHYGDQLKSIGGVGSKLIVVDIISRVSGANDTLNKDTFNPLLRLYWNTFADGFVDLASNPVLGADNAAAVTTYFSDTIHPTANAQLNIISPQIERAINMIYGNRDWSTATTYTASPAAATATTALSESGNTVTVTMASNPFVVGNCVVVAGVTAAGYNTAAGQCALVLTATATQITYYNATTGLSGASVQGTVNAAQEQDQDVYAILGGAAAGPVHTLQTCMGRTGQTIYRMITNTNATPWVLTPWVAGETINGAATMNAPVATALNHPIVALKSILTSNTAGGCTWQASIQ